jgi:hypothetical protein
LFHKADRSLIIKTGQVDLLTTLAIAQGVESAVLFALDQFCLIGYDLPMDGGTRRALYMGTV